MGIISLIPKEDRPREKALSVGIENLSDAELLALILHTGVKGIGVIDLSSNILNQYKNLYFLSKENHVGLKEIKGLNTAKILSLLATFEIANRIDKLKRSNIGRISNSNDLYNSFKYLNELNHEELILLVLDKEKHVIKERTLFRGTCNVISLEIKSILYELLVSNAYYFVIIHNRISGEVYPSEEDIITTSLIRDNASNLSIKMYDHLIIGKDSYYSFKDHGKLYENA